MWSLQFLRYHPLYSLTCIPSHKMLALLTPREKHIERSFATSRPLYQVSKWPPKNGENFKFFYPIIKLAGNTCRPSGTIGAEFLDWIFYSEKFINILIKNSTYTSQLIKTQVLKLAFPWHTQGNGSSHDIVRSPEWHSLHVKETE